MASLVRHASKLPSTLTEVVTGIVKALPVLFMRQKASFNWIDSLLTGIQTALVLFRRPAADIPKEATHE